MMVRFRTDAATIWADCTLQRAYQSGANQIAIGASGLDLYSRDETGRWRWAGATRTNSPQIRQAIVDGLVPGEREYALY